MKEARGSGGVNTATKGDALDQLKAKLTRQVNSVLCSRAEQLKSNISVRVTNFISSDFL